MEEIFLSKTTPLIITWFCLTVAWVAIGICNGWVTDYWIRDIQKRKQKMDNTFWFWFVENGHANVLYGLDCCGGDDGVQNADKPFGEFFDVEIGLLMDGDDCWFLTLTLCCSFLEIRQR